MRAEIVVGKEGKEYYNKISINEGLLFGKFYSNLDDMVKNTADLIAYHQIPFGDYRISNGDYFGSLSQLSAQELSRFNFGVLHSLLQNSQYDGITRNSEENQTKSLLQLGGRA
jgi:hypothetical protein